MGVVYEAHDPVIDRKVAIKLIRTDLLAGQERLDYMERFRREAQAAGRCSHPNVVAIFDFALHEGSPFLAMEYVDGVGLDTVLAQGERFAPAAAVHVIGQVLDALSGAHALGIVHRDIKPANMLLMEGGRVKVTDFGIARVASSNLTHIGMVVGTPSYMSPEQCRGGNVDLRSDLFSVATVLQEMLIGQRPFRGGNLTEIAYAVVNDAPAGAEELMAVAGPGLQSVIHRALAKAPQDRFASAAEMSEALRQAIRESPTSGSPAESVDRTLLAVRARGIAPEPIGGTRLDAAIVSGIERRLAHRLGPIARYLVQSSVRSAASAEDLCEALAQRIAQADDRRSFIAEALEVVRSGTGRPTAPLRSGADSGRAGPSGAEERSPIPLEEVERAQRALAEAIGPVARVLVKRALGQARTGPDLWELLAQHVSANERARFLGKRGPT